MIRKVLGNPRRLAVVSIGVPQAQEQGIKLFLIQWRGEGAFGAATARRQSAPGPANCRHPCGTLQNIRPARLMLVRLPSRCPRCDELEDLVAALKGTVGYYWALCSGSRVVLARLPPPRRPGSPYARWYDGPRADALRGYHPDVAPRWCSACSRPVWTLFKLPRRSGRAGPVCGACYLELVGRSPLVPWRDPVGE